MSDVLEGTKQVSTNIKGLPEGRNYFTERGYSQLYPWVEISRTAKTITLAKVEVRVDPEWHPEMHPGGFAAHCSNQSDQTWLFDRITDQTVTIRRNAHGHWQHTKHRRFREDEARYFYDYNF